MGETAATSPENDVLGSEPAGTGYPRGTPAERRAPGRGPSDPKLSASFRMLEERYARGELGSAEYVVRRADLLSWSKKRALTGSLAGWHERAPGAAPTIAAMIAKGLPRR